MIFTFLVTPYVVLENLVPFKIRLPDKQRTELTGQLLDRFSRNTRQTASEERCFLYFFNTYFKINYFKLKAARPASLPTKQQVSTGEEQSVLWLYTKLVFILGSEEIRAKSQ